MKHHKMKCMHPGGILVLRMSPNMDYIVIGTTEEELIIVDYKTSKELSRHALRRSATSVLFLKNGDQFLVGCINGDAALFSRKAEDK